MSEKITYPVVYETHKASTGSFTLRFETIGEEAFNRRIMANMNRLYDSERLGNYKIVVGETEGTFIPLNDPDRVCNEEISIKRAFEENSPMLSIDLDLFYNAIELLRKGGVKINACKGDDLGAGSIYFNGISMVYSHHDIFISFSWESGIDDAIGRFIALFNQSFKALCPDKEPVWSLRAKGLKVIGGILYLN